MKTLVLLLAVSLASAQVKLKSDVVDLVFGFGSETRYAVIIHSGVRNKTRHFSYHQTGHAIDFRLATVSNYKDRCSVMLQYQVDLDLLKKYLKKRGVLNKVGFGIYPDAHTPFFHVDTRGKKARWSRLNKRYVTFDEGERYIEQSIKRECK